MISGLISRDRVNAGIRPDGLWICADMAFNHATFCSPDDCRELI